MPDVIVVSAVVICRLSRPFNLAEACARIPGMAPDEALNAGVQKRAEPHCTVLAFPHGELLISGPQLPQTIIDVGEATAFLIADGMTVASSQVENVVCEAMVASSIDMAVAAESFGAGPPDQSLPEPRLEITFTDVGATAAIFPSGRVVVTGANDEEAINKILGHVLDTLGLELE
jgi:TATA-box binding protein (TBP) (component of TFIID and TFIIIB)